MNKDYQLRLLRASYNGLAGIKASALDGGRSNEATAIGKVQDCIEQVVNSLDEDEELEEECKLFSDWKMRDRVECTRGRKAGVRGEIVGFHWNSSDGITKVEVMFDDDESVIGESYNFEWISRPVDDGY